jgi:hypothetical protein
MLVMTVIGLLVLYLLVLVLEPLVTKRCHSQQFISTAHNNRSSLEEVTILT